MIEGIQCTTISIEGNHFVLPSKYLSERIRLCVFDIIVAGNNNARLTGTIILEQLHSMVEKFIILTMNVRGGFFISLTR
jgi:hypothetical protein